MDSTVGRGLPRYANISDMASRSPPTLGCSRASARAETCAPGLEWVADFQGQGFPMICPQRENTNTRAHYQEPAARRKSATHWRGLVRLFRLSLTLANSRISAADSNYRAGGRLRPTARDDIRALGRLPAI